jgi:hypothetical protein
MKMPSKSHETIPLKEKESLQLIRSGSGSEKNLPVAEVLLGENCVNAGV